MNVVVVGAGHMGRGVGLAYALGRHFVTWVDTKSTALEEARTTAARTVRLLTESGAASSSTAAAVLDSLRSSTDLESACRQADLVQEVVTEDLRLKQDLLARVEEFAQPDAIIATTTSSLRLLEIAARMKEPERLIGIHWFYPAYVVPVVELVRAKAQRESVLVRTRKLLSDMGRSSILVEDVPGFLVDRLQTAIRNTGLSLIESGIGTIQDIDLVVRHVLAPRYAAFGLFRLYDLIVSTRTSLHTSEYLYRATGEERYRPSELMRRKVEEGALGLASGKGWYDYSGLSVPQVEELRDRMLLAVYEKLREVQSRRSLFPEDEPRHA